MICLVRIETPSIEQNKRNGLRGWTLELCNWYLKSWLKLGPEDVLRLRKAVYGLINAPLRWHQRLSRALRQAGFVSLQTDPCAWILPASSPVKHVSPADVPAKLKAAVAD